jgi:hypothetical protein
MRRSANGRYLVEDDDTPFLYLADAAWTLFYHVTVEEAVEYVTKRREQGYNVIMPVLMREGGVDGMVNTYGEHAFVDNDPLAFNEPFFKRVDAILEAVEERGMHMALLPTWGEFVGPPQQGKGPVIFDTKNAFAYGERLAKRYKGRNVIWVNGGDRNPETGEQRDVYNALGDGLKTGCDGTHLVTYHPRHHSSKDFHEADWLDFNMMQTSTPWDRDNYNWVFHDYNLSPVKPTLDGEARYEHSHRWFGGKPPHGTRVTSHQVRKGLYNAMISGACGHTYGCRDVWSFHDPDSPPPPPSRDADLHWRVAIDLPGAYEVGLSRMLFEKYPWYRLVPDQERTIVVHGCGEGRTYTPAARAEDGSFALVYVPEAMPVWIDLGVLAGERIKAQWFDPRTGRFSWAGVFDANERQHFEHEHTCGDPDWVLVLESVS